MHACHGTHPKAVGAGGRDKNPLSTARRRRWAGGDSHTASSTPKCFEEERLVCTSRREHSRHDAKGGSGSMHLHFRAPPWELIAIRLRLLFNQLPASLRAYPNRSCRSARRCGSAHALVHASYILLHTRCVDSSLSGRIAPRCGRTLYVCVPFTSQSH